LEKPLRHVGVAKIILVIIYLIIYRFTFPSSAPDASPCTFLSLFLCVYKILCDFIYLPIYVILFIYISIYLLTVFVGTTMTHQLKIDGLRFVRFRHALVDDHQVSVLGIERRQDGKTLDTFLFGVYVRDGGIQWLPFSVSPSDLLGWEDYECVRVTF